MPVSRRLGSGLRALFKGLIVGVAALLVLLGAAILVLETAWAKNQIRHLIVRQANQYLTATLEIGRLGGSLFRGIELGDINLSRDGHRIIHVDDVALSYSLRELFQQGVVIRSLRIERPVVAAGREADGQWNLANLVRRDAREARRTGPGGPIEILSIEVRDATIALGDEVHLGDVHLPTRFDSLNARLSFTYVPVRWRVNVDEVSWRGSAPTLDVTRLTGAIENGPSGLTFHNLSVETPRSAFVLAGRINREQDPSVLDLQVHADRFAFQEWAGVLHGLKNIAVDASFDTTLQGPPSRLETTLRLQSTAGGIRAELVLNTTVPGWHAAGTVALTRLNLAGWLNRPERPSDISGQVRLDLALELGRHFPRGRYAFDGPHAMFLDYAGDHVHARGEITETAVLVHEASAVAYGAHVSLTAGSIGVDEPIRFRFEGTAAGVDLRALPTPVPVPHVESTLAFGYDVRGRFSDPYVAGTAAFSQSIFLGATIGDGAVGAIDTSVHPLTYSGDGDLANVDIHRFGDGLDVGWMRDPRYAGTLSGHFRVDGAGSDRESLRLSGGGRIARGELFGGTVSDADVTIDIGAGTLRASYDGRFRRIDPAIPLGDRRLAANVSGTANVQTTVRDLLVRTPTAADYDIAGTVALEDSDVRGVHLDAAHVDAAFREELVVVRSIDVKGPALEARGDGTVAFSSGLRSDFHYDISRADLAALKPLTGRDLGAMLSTSGRLTGPWDAPHLTGDASLRDVTARGLDVLSINGHYEATLSPAGLAQSDVQLNGDAVFIRLFDQPFEKVTGRIGLSHERLDVDLSIAQAAGRGGTLAGAALLRLDRREVDLLGLTIGLGAGRWQLATSDRPATIAWTDSGITVSPIALVAGAACDQRIELSGTWLVDGSGGLHVTATHVFLETLAGLAIPARYGGVLNADGIVRGTREQPIVTGEVRITDGRIDRFSYEQLAGRVDYSDQMFAIDLRLDQSPGAWLMAKGRVPLALLNPKLPERQIDVAVVSSPITLGLLSGVTDVIRAVNGQMTLQVHVIGTSRDPHFDGTIDVANAAFVVTATGARYTNGRAVFTLARDRITIDPLHFEDAGGRSLDVRGSLATHELRVGDLEIDATARRFEVLHNELGHLDIDAGLRVRGRFESPRLGGELTISGGTLNVDEILERVVFQPYATEPTALAAVDAVAALNPWNRLGLDLTLHVPPALRLTGENVQIAAGTPIGLGDINIRVGGDLYLYKDPGGQLSITGSLDSVSGTFAFQGRRFDIDETSSSINFRGELTPEVYVALTRDISGVLVRVTIAGDLKNPELRLASTPPLDQSDILSLIVFNTSVNDLTALQQQELAVRAGTLAAGFIATPLVAALKQTLGLESLEVEPSGDFGGPRVTVGEEIAPGLVARFSRQFGQDPYDEATVEYYLSRLLRIRATFSDAQSLTARAPFRRIERAGIDLLLFFSF